MDIQTLKSKIGDALPSIESLGEADPALERLHRSLECDIRAALAVSGDDEEEASGLAERLREITRGFAARHPRLEPVLEEITSLLASVGI